MKLIKHLGVMLGLEVVRQVSVYAVEHILAKHFPEQHELYIYSISENLDRGKEAFLARNELLTRKNEKASVVHLAARRFPDSSEPENMEWLRKIQENIQREKDKNSPK